MSTNQWMYSSDTQGSFGTHGVLEITAIAVGSSVIFFALYAYCGCLFLRRQNHRIEMAATARAPPGSTGLGPSGVAALPTFAYQRSKDKGADPAQCSVCLSLVAGGEIVRQLPECKHVFHPECIDMWLYSHTTCPLCRSHIGPPQEEVKRTTEAGEAPAAAIPPV